MKLRTLVRSLALLSAGVLLAACGTLQAYDGARLAPGDRAVVHSDPAVSAGLPVEVILRKVDDYDVPITKTKVELRPGQHHFIVDCHVRAAGSVTRFALDLVVEAGKSYRLVADATARGCDGVKLQ